MFRFGAAVTRALKSQFDSLYRVLDQQVLLLIAIATSLTGKNILCVIPKSFSADNASLVRREGGRMVLDEANKVSVLRVGARHRSEEPVFSWLWKHIITIAFS
jgi:hypothetical protein